MQIKSRNWKLGIVIAMCAPAFAAQIFLQNETIDTTAKKSAIAAAVAAPVNKLSRRGTIPYLVQFSGPIQEQWKKTLREIGRAHV